MTVQSLFISKKQNASAISRSTNLSRCCSTTKTLFNKDLSREENDDFNREFQEIVINAEASAKETISSIERNVVKIIVLNNVCDKE